MAGRHRLSREEAIAGFKKAIRKIERKRVSPKWLLPGMRKYLKKLEQGEV